MSHDSFQSNSISGIIGGFVFMTENHIALQIPMIGCAPAAEGRPRPAYPYVLCK